MLDRREIQPAPNEIQPQVELGNRAQRRKNRALTNRDPEAQKRSAIIGEYNQMELRMDRTNNEMEKVASEHGRDLTKIIYRGKPVIMRWLDVRRQLPEFLERAHFANLENPFVEPKMLDRYDPHDIFSQRIKVRRFGIFPIFAPSFLDIEQMPLLRSEDGLSLAAEDIKWINLIFHDDRFNPENNQKRVIRQSMFYLVTQRLARPEEKITIPDTLRPFHDRAFAFFDYYKKLLTNFDLDEWEESRLIRTLHWTAPFLPQTLGSFITASLEITPQSAIKLLQTRAELSPMPTFIWRRYLLRLLEFGAEDAFRINGLPKELVRYQHLDVQNDQTASHMLSGHYQGLRLTEADLEDAYHKKFEWLDKLTELYFKHLRQDTIHHPKKYLQINLADHPVLSDVLVTSQYANTLIFVLRFRDGKTHLTLEIDKDQRFYGLPANLVKDNPHFMDLILGDLLPPVLEWARTNYPGVEPIKLADYRKPEPVVSREERPQYNPEDFAEYRQKATLNSLKLLSPVAKLLAGPEPAQVSQTQAPKYVVFHSREKIREALGKNVQESDIDRVMRAIGEFEYGRGDFKKLKEDRVEGEDLWEVRVKGIHSRVLLTHVEGAFFTLTKAGPRSKIFNIRIRGN